jgi:hypothetical protein
MHPDCVKLAEFQQLLKVKQLQKGERERHHKFINPEQLC